MKYYLWMDEQEHGPYTAMQLQQMIADQQIPHDQTARAENSSEWQTVEELFQKITPELRRPAAPKYVIPLPESSPSNPPPVIRRRSRDPEIYLRGIRDQTCYRSLRLIINILFVLSLIAAAIPTLIALFATNGNMSIASGPVRFSASSISFGTGLFMLGILALEVIVIIGGRMFLLMLVDLVDTTLRDHAKNERSRDQ